MGCVGSKDDATHSHVIYDTLVYLVRPDTLYLVFPLIRVPGKQFPQRGGTSRDQVVAWCVRIFRVHDTPLILLLACPEQEP